MPGGVTSPGMSAHCQSSSGSQTCIFLESCLNLQYFGLSKFSIQSSISRGIGSHLNLTPSRESQYLVTCHTQRKGWDYLEGVAQENQMKRCCEER